MILASAQTSTGKKTFNVDSTNAGINIGSRSSDPSTVTVNGDMWYNSTNKVAYVVVNGAPSPINAIKTISNIVGIDFPNTVANSQSTVDVAVSGVLTSDIMFASPDGSDFRGGVIQAFCPVNGTVRFVFTNPTTGAIDPASMNMRLIIFTS